MTRPFQAALALFFVAVGAVVAASLNPFVAPIVGGVALVLIGLLTPSAFGKPATVLGLSSLLLGVGLVAVDQNLPTLVSVGSLVAAMGLSVLGARYFWKAAHP